jgi:hypothetical protein
LGQDPRFAAAGSRARAPLRGLARFVATLLVAALLLICTAPALPAAPAGLRDRLVVVVVDRVNIQEFPSAATPYCTALARRWSIGMLVTRTAEPRTARGKRAPAPVDPDLGADFVTLATGVKARGAQESELSFNSSERPAGLGGRTAGEQYSSYTGAEAPPSGVVCLGFQQVERNNNAIGNGDNVALMGKLLRESGRSPAVVGNSDTLSRAVRFAPLVCCDGRGAVPLGDVSDDTNVRAPGSPGGYLTSVPRLVEESARLLENSDMLVVDTGDTARLDRESPDTAPWFLKRQRAMALAEADRVVESLASLLDLDSSLLLVVSPGAPLDSRAEGDYLTPFIAAGKWFGRGLLTSQSTRRAGLVNNVDFLPTALRFFGLQSPSQVVGSSMSTVKGPADTVGYLKKLDQQAGATRKARWPVVVTYLVLALLVVLLAAACVPLVNGRLRWPREPGRLARFVAPAAVVLLSVPLSFVVVGAFRYRGYLFPALFCAAFSAVVGLGAWLLQRGRPAMSPVTAVCLLTTGVILVDLFAGGRLVMLPLLGDSALEGMRLYGLTNALVGLLLATAVWGVAGLAGRRALEPGAVRWAALAALLGLSFVIGFGALGANMGSFIAAFVTALTFFVATSGRGFTPLRVAGVALLTAAGTVFMIMLDSAFVHTHAGKMVSGGAVRFLPLVQRKLATQFGQIDFFLFPAILLIIVVVGLALWMRRPASFWRRRWEEERLQTATLFSLVVGSLVAMVFEDTGIAIMGVMTLVSFLVMAYYLTADGNAQSTGLRDLDP